MAGPVTRFQRNTSSELSLLSRIRSTNTTNSSTGSALARVPRKARLSRVRISFDGDPTGNWAGKLVVVGRGETGAILTLAEFGGAAAIGARDCLEWSLDPLSDLFDLSPGDVIRVETTVASGTITSAYVAFILGV